MASTVVKNTTAGYKIGSAASQKIGLFGATPVVQPASANQAAVTLTSAQNATTNGSDAGTTQTLANALKVSYNALQVDVAAMNVELTALRAALVALGAIKGAA